MSLSNTKMHRTFQCIISHGDRVRLLDWIRLERPRYNLETNVGHDIYVIKCIPNTTRNDHMGKIIFK